MTIAHLTRFAFLALALPLAAGTRVFAASDVTVELVSKAHSPSPASVGDSGELALSADGKWAVFTSTGNGIATNDNNGFNLDVFLRNNETGETALLSRNQTTGISGDGHSFSPLITPDGRTVVFQSEANLSKWDTNNATDFYFFSLAASNSMTGSLGFLTSANGVSLGGSIVPAISASGNIMLIETVAPLSPLDTNGSVDLYWLDQLSEQLDLVSAQSNSLAPASTAFSSTVLGNFASSMSADGRFVAFISSGTNHSPGVAPNAPPQIYLRDMQAQTNAWLTRSTNGAPPNVVASPVVSTNGEFVVFLSSAIPAVSSSTVDTSLYIYDIASGERRRISAPGNMPVEEFALSGNGQFIAYSSTNQIWIHDLATGTNILASGTTDGLRGSGVSSAPSISADGRIVVFTSIAPNLVAGVTNDVFQTYRFDRVTGEVALLSRAAAGDAGSDEDTLFPVVSADGSVAGFMSYSSNLVTNDNWLANDLFLSSTSGTGAVVLATAPNAASVSATPLGSSFVEAQALSLDGRYVIFTSHAANVVAGDTNSSADIFLRDLLSGTTKLISVMPDGTPHTGVSTFIGASFDAGVVAYLSGEVVTNILRRSLHLHHREAETNSLESILPTGVPAQTVAEAVLSADGRYLAFREATAPTSPLYIRDLHAGTTVRHTPPSTIGLEIVALSPGGKYLLTRNTSRTYALHEVAPPRYITNINSTALTAQPFTADESTMLIVAPGSTAVDGRLTLLSLDGSEPNIEIATNTTPLAISLNGSAVAYLQHSGQNTFLSFYDMVAGTNHTLRAGETNVPVRVRAGSGFSANGRYFAFLTTNSLTAVSHTFNKLYIYDTVLKSLRLASQNAVGEPAEFGAGNPSISGNGRLVVFDSGAANLVAADLNLSSDVFASRFAPIDSDADGLEDGWETIFFGGLTMTGDVDSDNDGVSNEDELFAGTDPNNAQSNLALVLEVDSEAGTLTITAPASPGLTYALQARADFSTGEWETIGEPEVALSNSVTFEAVLGTDAMEFFRIVAAQ